MLLEGLRKQLSTSARKVGVPAKIPSKNVLNMSPQYHYPTLFNNPTVVDRTYYSLDFTVETEIKLPVLDWIWAE
jgi:hypothetical protein